MIDPLNPTPGSSTLVWSCSTIQLPLTTCVQKIFVIYQHSCSSPGWTSRRPLSSVTASCHVLYSGAVLLSLLPRLIVDFSDSLLHFALQPLVDLLLVFILVGGISAGFYGAGVRLVYLVSQ